MNKIAISLLGIILVGIVIFHKYLFLQSPYFYYSLSIIGIVLVFYGLLSSFLKFQYILLILVFVEVCFWGYVKLMILKHKQNFPFRRLYWNFLIYNHRNYIQYNQSFGKYDKELFYTLKPNSVGEFDNFEFKNEIKTNSLGVRDDEESLKNPEIITIGDSFTMGWGVEKDQTVESILEKSTGKKTLNLGVSSYGTFREYQILKRANKDSLKLIVLQYHETDIEENFTKLSDEKAGKNLNTNLTPENYQNELYANILNYKYFPFKGILCLVSNALIEVKGKIDFSKKQTPLPPKKLFDFTSGKDNLLYFNKIVERIRNEYKVPILVYYVGLYQDIEDTFENHYANHEGIHYIVTNKKLETNNFFVIDEHTNPSGQKKVAELIIEDIKTRNLLK